VTYVGSALQDNIRKSSFIVDILLQYDSSRCNYAIEELSNNVKDVLSEAYVDSSNFGSNTERDGPEYSVEMEV